jgi:hypothetical protein
MNKETKQQLSLLVFGDMDVATKGCFSVEERKDENQNPLSMALKPKKASDVAVMLGLDVKQDADQIADYIMEDSDRQIDRMIEWLARIKQDPTGFWTGSTAKLVYGKPGKTGKISKARLAFNLIESRRVGGPSDAAIVHKLAKTYQLPGEKIEDAEKRVLEMWQKQTRELLEAKRDAIKNVVDIKGEKVGEQAPGSNKPEDEMPDDEELEKLTAPQTE